MPTCRRPGYCLTTQDGSPWTCHVFFLVLRIITVLFSPFVVDDTTPGVTLEGSSPAVPALKAGCYHEQDTCRLHCGQGVNQPAHVSKNKMVDMMNDLQ